MTVNIMNLQSITSQFLNSLIFVDNKNRLVKIEHDLILFKFRGVGKNYGSDSSGKMRILPRS